MKRTRLFLLPLLAMMACTPKTVTENTSGNSLDSITHSELKAFRDMHFGMFVHFGVYSELGGVWQGKQIPYYAEQIMNHARIAIPDYEAVARQFNPTLWDADEVVRLAKAAGMEYLVVTTKHHDGFCMFKTNTTDYNIVDYTPFGRDVLAELSAACQKHGIKLGLYYSLTDWHYPQGIGRMPADTTTDCTTFVNQVYSPLEILTPELEAYSIQQITELLTNYGPIETIWFDMGLPTLEQSQHFRETVKALQPECLINGRIMNRQGDYLTLPDNGQVAGYTEQYWDNPASLYGSWGYKSWIQRPEIDVQVNRQLQRLYSTVRHGGVFLLNIGPCGDGSVLPYEKEVLTRIGDSLRAHPDTLNKIQLQQPIAPIVEENVGMLVLNDENGLAHAAFDAQYYLSTQADSWRSWNLNITESGDYEAFIEYLPKQVAKSYRFQCGGNSIERMLPGVDDMMQTAYIGIFHLEKGKNTFTLDQAQRNDPLESLGLKLGRIVLRKL